MSKSFEGICFSFFLSLQFSFKVEATSHCPHSWLPVSIVHLLLQYPPHPHLPPFHSFPSVLLTLGFHHSRWLSIPLFWARWAKEEFAQLLLLSEGVTGKKSNRPSICLVASLDPGHREGQRDENQDIKVRKQGQHLKQQQSLNPLLQHTSLLITDWNHKETHTPSSKRPSRARLQAQLRSTSVCSLWSAFVKCNSCTH